MYHINGLWGMFKQYIYISIIILKNTEYKMSLLTMVLFVSWNENVPFLYNWCNIGLNIFCSVRITGIIFWQFDISNNIIKVVWNAASVSAFGKHDINLSHYAVNVNLYICANQHKFWNYVPLSVYVRVGGLCDTVTVTVEIYKIYAHWIISRISTCINPVQIFNNWLAMNVRYIGWKRY